MELQLFISSTNYLLSNMYLEACSKYDIILGSRSPRRAFLLKEAGIKFRQESKDADENYPDNLHREEIVRFLAEKKAAAFNDELTQDQLLITADTIVVFNDDVLGKPNNEIEARELLSRLSANTHTVYTGVCIKTLKRSEVFSKRTDVSFKFLSSAEIDYYIRNYEPYDKAGAYGIQEWFGYVCVDKIEGSYTNVMGLPVKEVCEHLNSF